jgi:hypothetical protein
VAGAASFAPEAAGAISSTADTNERGAFGFRAPRADQQ